MDPIFRKCLKAIEHINNNSLPTMGTAYKNYLESSKNRVENSDCLNETKAYAVAADKSLDSGYIDNSNVKALLSELAGLDRRLQLKSKDLHELFAHNESRYKNVAKKMARQNKHFLYEMKNGTTPAQELLQEIVQLGKSIQQITNEEIPNYKREIENFLKKTENSFCESASRLHDKIIKMDPGTLPRIQPQEWFYLQHGLFERKGAFELDSYEV